MSYSQDEFATFVFPNSDFANEREKLFLIYVIGRFELFKKPAKYDLNLGYNQTNNKRPLYDRKRYMQHRPATDANLKQIFCQIERCE